MKMEMKKEEEDDDMGVKEEPEEEDMIEEEPKLSGSIDSNEMKDKSWGTERLQEGWIGEQIRMAKVTTKHITPRTPPSVGDSYEGGERLVNSRRIDVHGPSSARDMTSLVTDSVLKLRPTCSKPSDEETDESRRFADYDGCKRVKAMEFKVGEFAIVPANGTNFAHPFWANSRIAPCSTNHAYGYLENFEYQTSKTLNHRLRHRVGFIEFQGHERGRKEWGYPCDEGGWVDIMTVLSDNRVWCDGDQVLHGGTEHKKREIIILRYALLQKLIFNEFNKRGESKIPDPCSPCHSSTRCTNSD